MTDTAVNSGPSVLSLLASGIQLTLNDRKYLYIGEWKNEISTAKNDDYKWQQH